ncbi:MAG: NAD-binding protein [Armatimonadetes bacterium]|nr:NAD-binding protein [Armatimonadota bacterium]
MAGHCIVCGMGQVGYRVVDMLRRLGESVTVVTQTTRDEWLHTARAGGVKVLLGDARDAQLLAEAGIQDACTLIAATDQDLVNIEIALDAKQLRPDLPVVIRLFDQTLARQLEATFDIRRALAMSALTAPTFAAAAMGERIAGSFSLDGTLFVIGRQTIDPGSPLVSLTVRQVGEQYGLATLTHECGEVGRAPAPHLDTTLAVGDCLTVVGPAFSWHQLARAMHPANATPSPWRKRRAALWRRLRPVQWFDVVRQIWRHAPAPLRTAFIALNALALFSVLVFHLAMNLTLVDAFYFVIATVTTVGYGDISPRGASPWLQIYVCLVMMLGSATIATVSSIITDFVVTARFQQMLGRQRLPDDGHILVVGLGNVGYRIVDELRRAGAPVAAIERHPDGEFVEAIRAHTPVVIGDARVRDTLVQAGVANAYAVIVVTNDDAVNLGVALAAKEMNPRGRTVVRLFDADFARKVQTALNVDATVSTASMAAPVFAAAALYPDVDGAFELDDRLFMVLHRTVGAEWHGITPAHLRAKRQVMVLMRRCPAGIYGVYSLAQDNVPLESGEKVLALVWRELAA